jgi:hypothetical protein
MTPAGNCQACAARHAGFKSWEILTIKEDSSDKTAAEAAGAAPLPAFMSKPVTAKKPAIEPVKEAEPVVEKPVAVPVAVTPVAAPVPAPVVDKPKVEVAAPEPAPVVAQPKTEAAVPAPEKKEEGFKAEDGTIIPWDQLPPEFRPRK